MSGAVAVLPAGRGTLVRLSGDVDLDLGEELDSAVSAAIARYEPIRIDCSEVTFMDSTGLTLVSRLVVAESQLERRVQLAGASERTRELLAISGLLAAIDVV